MDREREQWRQCELRIKRYRDVIHTGSLRSVGIGGGRENKYM